MRLTVRGLTAGFDKRILFRNLECEVESGEMIAVMGPSGSGKSTLLGVMAGALKPLAGTATIDRRDESSAARVDWVVQSSPLLMRRTVVENAELGYRIRFGDSSELRIRTLRVLRDLGLDQLANSRVHLLSGGERQRISIARTALARPDVVLADEPTASLDAESRQAVIDVLRCIASEGAIVVIATHDPFVSQRCDASLALDGLGE